MSVITSLLATSHLPRVALAAVLAASCAPIEDAEERPLPFGACPNADERGAPDSDGDGAINRCDNCPELANKDQADADFDGVGDACSDDDDGDGIEDAADLCPRIAHPSDADTDEDGLGDACDRCPGGEDERDTDEDGIDDCADLCPLEPDPDQTDTDADGMGDACDRCPLEAGLGCEAKPVEGFEPLEASAASVRRAIEGGASCREVIEAHLERIARYDLALDGDEPPINAMVALNPAALEEAARLDRARARGEVMGPLHCVPIAVKDLFNVVGVPVSAGTLAMEGIEPSRDAVVVSRLKEAGAIILGSTAMDELSKGIHGISSRSGRVGNAYDTRASPGGSSSGSGAAVAASFVVGALGTDNCASLTVPAAYHGLVTLRPTRGLVPLTGVFPSNYLDAVAGPMTRSVRDAALVLDAIAGADFDDARTQRAERPASFVAALKPEALSGARIGVLRSYGVPGEEQASYAWAASGQVLEVFKRSAREIERLGAELVENVHLPGLDTDRTGAGFGDEAREYLRAWTESGYDDFGEVCERGGYSAFAYTSKTACVANARWSIEEAGVGSDWQRHHAARYAENLTYLERAMDALRLDALLLPVDDLGHAGRGYASRTHCVVSSVTGAPAVVLHAGSVRGMPVGMMLVGRAWDDARLLAFAADYERSTRHRRPPALFGLEGPVSLPDPAAFYEQRLRLGRLSYERWLRDGAKFDLTASRFAAIAREVVGS